MFVNWMKPFFKLLVKQINQESKFKKPRKKIIIKQDNTSAIQLEHNKWKSSSKRTKYIDVRYFYITDKLKNSNVTEVVYKPTEYITSDYLMKALQGKLFSKHCDTLMGLKGVANQWQFYWKYKEGLKQLCVSGWGTT